MGDVLSQSEIDNLLAALSSGEIDADEMKTTEDRQVKNYDFKRPSKFSKEHLRTLVIIFDHYARLLSTDLPAYLRKNVSIEVMNSEAVTYSEFSNALSNPVILGIVDFAPLQGNIIIELAENIGYTIIDRMLGGSGTPLEKTRDFSEIELSILERIMNVCTNLLKEPWQSVLPLEPRLERIETNSQFAQIISPNEMTSIITMNIKIGDVEGLMNVCIPYTCVEEIIDKLNTKFWYSNIKTQDKKVYHDVIETAISRASIPIRAILGKSTISVTDFVNIQKGDIIRLNTKIEDELEVYVGNVKKFTGLPGSSNESYAVRVTSIIKEE